MRLHEQSAQSQRQARRSQQTARDEIYRRLDGKVMEVDNTDTAVVAVVTTRELIRLVEAESNIVKTEAMAQRSYDIHRMASSATSPAAGSIEDFVAALESERHEDPEPL